MRLGPCLLHEGRTLQGARSKLADFCSTPMAGSCPAVDSGTPNSMFRWGFRRFLEPPRGCHLIHKFSLLETRDAVGISCACSHPYARMIFSPMIWRTLPPLAWSSKVWIIIQKTGSSLVVSLSPRTQTLKATRLNAAPSCLTASWPIATAPWVTRHTPGAATKNRRISRGWQQRHSPMPGKHCKAD